MVQVQFELQRGLILSYQDQTNWRELRKVYIRSVKNDVKHLALSVAVQTPQTPQYIADKRGGSCGIMGEACCMYELFFEPKQASEQRT